MTDHATMKQRATTLRCDQTPAERILWAHLRLRNLRGVRFLRQRIVGPFILDFYAPSIRLAIELDGGQHYEASEQGYDERRTQWLCARGITVLRYTNLDISRELNNVLADIGRAVDSSQGTSRRPCAHPPGAARRPPSSGSG